MKIYIDKIIMYHFQHYKDRITFKLSRNITVIAGLNNTGKSTIRRAFTIFAKPLPQSKLLGYITKGETICEVILVLSNNYHLIAQLEKSTPKRGKTTVTVTFFLKDSTTDTVIKTWYRHSHEITDLLRWLVIQTNNTSMCMNFKLSAEHLFIDTDGMLNTEVFDGLCYNKDFEDRIDNVEKAIKKIDETIEVANKEYISASARRSLYKKINTAFLKKQRIYIRQMRSYLTFLLESLERTKEVQKMLRLKQYCQLLDGLEKVMQYKLIEEKVHSNILFGQYEQLNNQLVNIVKYAIAQDNYREAQKLSIVSNHISTLAYRLEAIRSKQILLCSVGQYQRDGLIQRYTELIYKILPKEWLLQSYRAIQKCCNLNQLLDQLSQSIREKILVEQQATLSKQEILNKTYYYLLSYCKNSALLLNLQEVSSVEQDFKKMAIFDKFMVKADEIYLKNTLIESVKKLQYFEVSDKLLSTCTALNLENSVLFGLKTCQNFVENRLYFLMISTNFEQNLMLEKVREFQNVREIQSLGFKTVEKLGTLNQLQQLMGIYKEIQEINKIEKKLAYVLSLIPVCPVCKRVYIEDEHAHIKGRG